MGRRVTALLVVGLVALSGLLLAQGARDPVLSKGIFQVNEGDLQGALETLGPLVRKLSSDPTRVTDLAQAYLYVGVAYLGLDNDKAGRASFREALRLQKGRVMTATAFPARVVRVFEEVKRNAALAAGTEKAGPGAAEQTFWSSIASSQDPKDFEEYLRKYPDGEFAGLARNKVARLNTTSSPAPVPPPSGPRPASSPCRIFITEKKIDKALYTTIKKIDVSGKGLDACGDLAEEAARPTPTPSSK